MNSCQKSTRPGSPCVPCSPARTAAWASCPCWLEKRALGETHTSTHRWGLRSQQLALAEHLHVGTNAPALKGPGPHQDHTDEETECHGGSSRDSVVGEGRSSWSHRRHGRLATLGAAAAPGTLTVPAARPPPARARSCAMQTSGEN